MQATQQRRQVSLETIELTERGRAMLFGKTRSGKSTLAEVLIAQFLKKRKHPRVVILDGKPRFRAQWELNGWPASHRYKRWKRGPVLPNSYVLPMVDPKAELEQVWRLGGTVAIAQTAEQSEIGRLRDVASALYSTSWDKYDQLLYVDEASDFFGTTGAASRGDALLKAVRSGGEMNISFLAGAQRPKGLPHSFLTELSDVYLFRLASLGDLDHLDELGVPVYDGRGKPLSGIPPRENYIFHHFDMVDDSHGIYRLSKDLIANPGQGGR